MKIVVSGSTGQLGMELAALQSNYDTYEWAFFDRSKLDLSDDASIRAVFETEKPDWFINCAAYTAVDKAESDRDAALQINGNAPGLIAQLCTETGAKLVHISTDYVFDGNGTAPYKVDHLLSPVNYYGASKLVGEELVRKNAADNSVIIRTSWVYSEFGKNFVKTMLNLMATRPTLNVVGDQIGAPTYARDLAEAIVKVIASSNFVAGTYHYCNEGEISWFDFATAIGQLSGSDCVVSSIPSSEFPTPAKRPAYSLMDTTAIVADYGVVTPYWVSSLKDCLIKLGKTN